MIVSCFVVITTSQFILGLWMVVVAAGNGRESVTKCHHNSYPLRCFSDTVSTDPISGLYPVQLYSTGFHACRTSLHISRIRYETSFVFHLRDTHFDCPTDFLAFFVIVYLVVRSNINRVPIPSLLRTMARDATSYFLMIFTSHFVSVMFIRFASVGISS